MEVDGVPRLLQEVQNFVQNLEVLLQRLGVDEDVVQPPLNAALGFHRPQGVSQEGRENGRDCREAKAAPIELVQPPTCVPESRLVAVAGFDGKLVVRLRKIEEGEPLTPLHAVMHPSQGADASDVVLRHC